MTQQNKIILALQIAGRKGINSFVAREELKIIQLPTRVWELKRLGHTIATTNNDDGSVQYTLLGSPRVAEVKQSPSYYFKGNVAYLKEEPRQENFI